MKYRFARIFGLFAVLMLDVATPRPADACGIKLTVKPTGPRKAVARSARPSRILLLGNPPRRLERDLSAAGHSVDSRTPKQNTYAVVVVDSNDQAADAQAKYGDAAVIVRSGDVGADMKTVESSLARKPVAVAAARTPTAARPTREVVAAGPPESQRREVVAVKPPSEPVSTPAATPPTRTEPARTEPPPEPKPEPKPTPPPPDRTAPDRTPSRPAQVTRLDEEIFFGYNRVEVRASNSTKRAVSYLASNASATIVVEGHADPAGNPDANLKLGQLRAEAVRDALVAAGADASRIEVKSYGDTQLKYGASDARNRRVVIRPK